MDMLLRDIINALPEGHDPYFRNINLKTLKKDVDGFIDDIKTFSPTDKSLLQSEKDAFIDEMHRLKNKLNDYPTLITSAFGMGSHRLLIELFECLEPKPEPKRTRTKKQSFNRQIAQAYVHIINQYNLELVRTTSKPCFKLLKLIKNDHGLDISPDNIIKHIKINYVANHRRCWVLKEHQKSVEVCP